MHITPEQGHEGVVVDGVAEHVAEYGWVGLLNPHKHCVARPKGHLHARQSRLTAINRKTAISPGCRRMPANDAAKG